MHRFQNYIIKEIPLNISDTFVDISTYNRAITRNKLIFSGVSLFDIQFLYPLFSDLTYPPSRIKIDFTATSYSNSQIQFS